MTRKHRTFAAAILMLICLSGCGTGKIAGEPPRDVLERSTAPEPAGELETVGIYIDATPSMAGFLNNTYVKNKRDTLYSRFLYQIGSLLTGKYSQIEYYRTNTSLLRAKGSQDVLERARKASFYQSSEDSKGNYDCIGKRWGSDHPCLAPALEYGKNQDLSILITDFYENSTGNNANVNTLTAQIRDLASAGDGKVFGLIGVRSEFSGEISDSGPNGETVKYGTDSLKYRPFYLIVRGHPEHVKDLFQGVEEVLTLLGARKGEDYEASIFYDEPFWSVDYTSYMGCGNFVARSKFSGPVWQDNIKVAVSAVNGAAGNANLPVYATTSKCDSFMYFAYSVDSARQERFHDLAETAGKAVTLDFLPEGEKELCALPCSAHGLTASRWNKTDTFEEEEEPGMFEVCGLYYDRDTETLYAELRLTGKALAPGLWRFQWRHTLEGSAERLKSRWQQWHTSSDEPDYSKTERLNGYVAPMRENMANVERNVLNGVVYLTIAE